MELTISAHARERFAERIMDKETNHDVATYVTTHSETIDERINKMVEFGEKIYTGKSLSEYNKAITDVYLKDLWVIIVDPGKQKVITLYSIDLGLGDDFNKDYITRLLTKLDFAKMNLSEVENDLAVQRQTYENLIAENEIIINENKRINNELNKLNDGYKELLSNLYVKIDIATQEVREVVGILVGRKVY